MTKYIKNTKYHLPGKKPYSDIYSPPLLAPPETFSAFPLSSLLLHIIILLVTRVTPPLFGSPRSELQDLPRGPAIQRCRRILVKINGGEETTMDLHHSPSPALLLFTKQAACPPGHSPALTVPTPVSCPSLCVNLWTPERRWEVIYRLLQKKRPALYLPHAHTVLEMKMVSICASAAWFHPPAGVSSDRRWHVLVWHGSKKPANSIKRISLTSSGWDIRH